MLCEELDTYQVLCEICITYPAFFDYSGFNVHLAVITLQLEKRPICNLNIEAAPSIAKFDQSHRDFWKCYRES